MSPGRALPRAAAAAVLLAGGLSATVASAKPAPDPAADDATIAQPLAADSGDGCGSTKGTFGWHVGTLTVDVNGTVTDRSCFVEPYPDLYSTVARFTALTANKPARLVTQEVDNGQRDFEFSFPGPVQAITVQVCRHASQPVPLPAPPDYCGPKQAYRPPTATPVRATTHRTATAIHGPDQPED